MKKEVWIFTTTTCLPCKQLKSHLAGVPGISGNLRYIVMDGDDSAQKLAQKYGITKAPSVLCMVDAVPKQTIDGHVSHVVKQIQHFLCEGASND